MVRKNPDGTISVGMLPQEQVKAEKPDPAPAEKPKKATAKKTTTKKTTTKKDN